MKKPGDSVQKTWAGMHPPEVHLCRDQCVAPPSIERMRCSHQGFSHVI